jgi:outer membrane immunogenic protein
MKRIALIAAVGLLVFATAAPAISADSRRPAYKSPVYVAPFTWSGFYVGINGSYGWGNASFTDSVLGSSTAKATGYLEGATIGYNLQTGSWVWGVEGDFDFSTVKGAESTVCAPTPGCEMRNRWLSTGRGRIGYAFDRFLVYGTGGAAYGELKFTNPGGGSETKSKLGWTLGAGVERALMGAWSIKAEYLYVDLGSVNCSPTACGPDSHIKMPLNIARLGVNYRF